MTVAFVLWLALQLPLGIAIGRFISVGAADEPDGLARPGPVSLGHGGLNG